VFVIEEVWFRGGFDSHIYHLGEGNADLTAVYVSLLWGAWHFPITYTSSDSLTAGITLVVDLLLVQGAIGYFLSIYWRKSGNLIVPGSVHAFVDSIRNGLII
jgi:membrane protease YdiL (CAAX protease family)